MSKPVKHTCKGCNKEKVFRADQLYCSKDCARRPKEAEEKVEMVGDDLTISLPKTRIHTLEQLLEFCKVDPAIWHCEKFQANKWEMGYVGEDGKAAVEPLYQIKAFLKRKVHLVDARKEVEALIELAKQKAREPELIYAEELPSGNMLEIAPVDPHFGKLAWPAETGHAAYDTKIATEIHDKAVDTILDRAVGLDYDEILLVLGNDMLNSDDVEGRTTKGTYVSTDTRYQKTFVVARDWAIRNIEKCRKYANKVHVKIIPGNHDRLGAWHLGDSLECYFYNYHDVEIDNSPTLYKYYQFGQVMLLFTHGDKGKRADYPLLMATEQPKMFGETKFREAHTGHFHHTKVDEHHGVRVRILSTLTAPDAWHAENTYVGAQRCSEAFIWNKESGLLGTIIYTEVEDAQV